MRRRPLLRAAAIGGGAYAAGKRRERTQQREYDQEPVEAGRPPPAAPAPAPAPAAPAPDAIAQFKELGELHASGVLTDEEFAAQKAKVLGS